MDMDRRMKIEGEKGRGRKWKKRKRNTLQKRVVVAAMKKH